MSINGWLMVRAKKSGHIHGAQEPKGLQKTKRQKMNSAHEGISQPCENSQPARLRKFVNVENFTLHEKAPAFCYTCKIEKT